MYTDALTLLTATTGYDLSGLVGATPELSDNWLDRDAFTIGSPAALGDGTKLVARFLVLTAVAAASAANGTLEFQIVAQPKTGSTYTATFTAATTDIITATAHGLINGTRITVATAGTLPTGMAANTSYYVIDAATDTFKVSTSPGGTALDITGAGSGTHTLTWYPEILATTGAIPHQRLIAGATAFLPIMPVLMLGSGAPMPLPRYVYGRFVTSNGLADPNGGIVRVDLTHCQETAKTYYPSGYSIA